MCVLEIDRSVFEVEVSKMVWEDQAYRAGWAAAIFSPSVSDSSEEDSASATGAWVGADGKASFLTSGEVERPRYWLTVSWALAVACWV